MEIAAEVARLIPRGPATIAGTLHHFPGYPAVRLTAETAIRVQGHLFELPFEISSGPTLLDRLDAYEGFHPHDPAASLFLRQRTSAMLPEGTQLPCWVYTYNHPFPAIQ